MNWDPRHCVGSPPPPLSPSPAAPHEESQEENEIEEKSSSLEKQHRLRVKRRHLQHISSEQQRLMLSWELFDLLYNK